MTYQELANKLDMGLSTLRNIEAGLFNTSIERLHDIKELFNISLDDLVYKNLEDSPINSK